MPRTEFKQVDLARATELNPGFADTTANVEEGYDKLLGTPFKMWVSETEFAILDELYTADAEVCSRCHVAVLEGVGENTCYERVCPECWDDEPRPCHRDCFE